MKVWKSPVFYFGILLVLAVGGLLAAPYVVNWNSYRADLESYGRTLTGREVTINGAISVNLFPWPQLRAEDISIANLPGSSSPDFATAESVTARMTLAGLMRGGIDVESIDFEAPVVHLERLATGEGNWLLAPSADLTASDVLSRVKLDQVRLHDGTVSFSDRQRGETVRLDDVNASLASPSIAGPWRLRSAAVYNDRLLDIAINTAAWRTGEPFRFGVRVGNADGSGLAWSFDGQQTAQGVDGDFRVAKAATGDGKGDTEGRVRPLALTAKVTGNFDEIKFTKLEVSPVDPSQGGAITTGTASLTLGRHIAARVDLSAAMLDLDDLAGAKSRTLLRQAGSLALADNFLALLPANVSVAGGLKVTALKTEGETLENVEAAFEVDRERLRINRFASGLPGRSQMLFEGNFFPSAAGAELSGSLALESNDLRALTFWLWPEGQAGLGETWSGSRGRFKAQTDVSLTPSRLRFVNAEYELDGERGKAELAVTSAGRGAVNLQIDAGRFNLDAYAPQGFSAVSKAAAGGAGGLAALALPHAGAPDMILKFNARELVLNGVTAADAELDLEAGANGLNLRNLKIGSVGGATLNAFGLVLDSGKGADGEISLDIAAQDPRELLKLAGLIRGDERPAWAGGLGTTAITGNVTVKPAAAGPEVSATLKGVAGDIELNGQGALGQDQSVSATAEVRTRSSGRMMGLLGFTPAIADEAPAVLRLQAAGTLAEGFMSSAMLQAYEARLDYQGALNPLAPFMGLDGKLSLRSTDAGLLLAATGLPFTTLADAVLVADSAIAADQNGLRFSDLTGRFGQERFAGKAELSGGTILVASLDVSRLRLADVLRAALLDWSGSAPGQDRPFAAALPFGLTGEIDITPAVLEIHSHFLARDGQIILKASAGETQLAAFAKDEQGRAAEIELTSRGADANRKLEGFVRAPVDLSRQMALADGTPAAAGEGTIELRFSTEGRSPGGALASLKGSGSFDFENFKLLGLDPRAFTTKLAEAKDAAGITAAFEALKTGQGVDFGKITGSVTITEGEVGLLPFSLKTPDADLQVKTVAELALGEIDSSVTLSLKAREGLPAMTIAYAGPPMALSRSEDISELATKLGVTIMQAGIDELERLQQEQKRLAAEEEKQRIEDEARLAAYYAQRDELLLRRRELKVFAEMRAAEAERLREQIEAERAANAGINKSELKQRAREIRVLRKLARQAQAAPAKKPEKPGAEAPKPAQPVRPRQQSVEPVVLVSPEGAPVVIAPPPSASPTQ